MTCIVYRIQQYRIQRQHTPNTERETRVELQFVKGIQQIIRVTRILFREFGNDTFTHIPFTLSNGMNGLKSIIHRLD